MELFDIEEKKPELLAAHAAGPAGHAASSSVFFSATSKSSTLTSAVSTGHFACAFEPADGMTAHLRELWTMHGRWIDETISQ